MKSLILVILLTASAKAATTYNNSEVLNVSVSTGAAAYTKVLDLRGADSASWQMDFVCASGSVTISESNDALNWTSVNVAGSSITVVNAGGNETTTLQNFAIASPPYAWYQFNVTNSSAPAVSGAGLPCTLTATQALKSDTITGN